MSKKNKLKKILIVFAILLLLPLVWFGRYRFYNVQSSEYLNLMTPQDLEGYTDKLFYNVSDTIKLYSQSKVRFQYCHSKKNDCV